MCLFFEIGEPQNRVASAWFLLLSLASSSNRSTDTLMWLLPSKACLPSLVCTTLHAEILQLLEDRWFAACQQAKAVCTAGVCVYIYICIDLFIYLLLGVRGEEEENPLSRMKMDLEKSETTQVENT